MNSNICIHLYELYMYAIDILYLRKEHSMRWARLESKTSQAIYSIYLFLSSLINFCMCVAFCVV